MQECQFANQPKIFIPEKKNMLRVGQHPGINQNATRNKCKITLLKVGQHPRMVGELNQECWVNMLRNLHFFYFDGTKYYRLSEYQVERQTMDGIDSLFRNAQLFKE